MIHLYVKTHIPTGIRYFGKTEAADPSLYQGSGTLWKRILEKYAGDVETEIVATFPEEQKEECKAFAIKFSVDNNIVESDDWANLKIEELDGGFTDINYGDVEQSRKWKVFGGKRCHELHPDLAKNNLTFSFEECSKMRKKGAATQRTKYGITADGKSNKAVERGRKSAELQTDNKKAQIAESIRGMKAVNNGSITTKAKGDELAKLLESGWVLGVFKDPNKPKKVRPRREQSDEAKAKIAAAMRKYHSSKE